jgi:hypothetical protein
LSSCTGSDGELCASEEALHATRQSVKVNTPARNLRMQQL